ncbi:hypothetical protein PP404_06320 [Mycobacteroides abscessus]|nr:hypothetical protein [Mycobacteroides abscessus]MDM2176019.1 hypothetical protein [Mycobacteroides abscessus]MDM2207083.1 hypothetical protein [Mycobacteroides abscessus]MDM2210177.1 hypothetical protein [Mycobacteroides abscessus]MDM2217359.1 hypothetical protein [Mycobacteroides abscessus]
MKRPTLRKVVASAIYVKKAGMRATKASAKLENRVVPANYQRPSAIEDYIAKQRRDMHDA